MMMMMVVVVMMLVMVTAGRVRLRRDGSQSERAS
jgi:hypothetical protein